MTVSYKIKSPFKFLDAFTSQDADVFFGRDQEIETLYKYVNRNHFVLVYGPSGTGKTSLVRCGLVSRFDLADWYPIYIRRQEDMNLSLLEALQKEAGDPSNRNLINLLWRINTRSLRPVHLIFDQVEELLILGKKKEQEKFMNAVAEILSDQLLSCHILFILREEYLGRLYHYERLIPSLFKRKLRVEKMSNTAALEVVHKSCAKFEIDLEKPTENAQQILDNISGGKAAIPLPFLQVYLDLLYKNSVNPEAIRGEKGELPKVQFTSSKIRQIGKIENVLEQFLKEQEVEVQRKLEDHFDNTSIDTVGQLLDAFVTEEGTKSPLRFTRINNIVLPDERAHPYFRSLSSEVLSFCIEELEKCRILRSFDQIYELAHDELAAIIDRERTEEQRQLNDARSSIKYGYTEFMRSGMLFKEEQLFTLEPLLPKLKLGEEYQEFLEKSRVEVEKTKKQELEKRERELKLVKEKLAMQRRSVKIQKWFLASIGVVAIVAMIAFFWAFYEKNNAIQAQELAVKLQLEADSVGVKLKKEVFEKELQAAKEMTVNGEYFKALEKLIVLQKRELAVDSINIDSIIRTWGVILSHLEEADRLSNNNLHKEALESYKKAYKLENQQSNYLKLRIKEEEGGIDRATDRFKDLKERAMDILKSHPCNENGLYYLKEAQKINSSDEEINEKLKKCDKIKDQ